MINVTGHNFEFFSLSCPKPQINCTTVKMRSVTGHIFAFISICVIDKLVTGHIFLFILFSCYLFLLIFL